MSSKPAFPSLQTWVWVGLVAVLLVTPPLLRLTTMQEDAVNLKSLNNSYWYGQREAGKDIDTGPEV